MRLDGPLAYYLDFVLFPIAIAAATWLDRKAMGLQWFSIAFAGAVAFTYIEYWVHRSALHGPFWSGTHERHHLEPEEYVVFPALIVPIGFAGLYAIAYLTSTVALWVGFATGYVWFIYWHNVLHHMGPITRPAWIGTYQAWHLRHHTNISCNFGITVPFYDWLHGTSR